MAHAEYKPHPISAPGLIKGALLWIWDGLIAIGENSARARVVQQINDMSDKQLADFGLTREEVVRRMISDGYHI